MAKTYLQLTPAPGKWYVSERIPATKMSGPIIDPTKTQPKRSRSEMILAGPFDSRVLATTWNNETSASGYIWEVETNTPRPSPK